MLILKYRTPHALDQYHYHYLLHLLDEYSFPILILPPISTISDKRYIDIYVQINQIYDINKICDIYNIDDSVLLKDIYNIVDIDKVLYCLKRRRKKDSRNFPVTASVPRKDEAARRRPCSTTASVQGARGIRWQLPVTERDSATAAACTRAV